MDYDLRTFRGDLFGGVTSALVVPPVALAFGVASGLGATAGIYGAIVVVFFAWVFGDPRSRISDTPQILNILQQIPEGHLVDTLDEARRLAYNFLKKQR